MKMSFRLFVDEVIAKNNYGRAFEIEFDAKTSDVLDHISPKEAVEYFDNDELLECMDEAIIRKYIESITA